MVIFFAVAGNSYLVIRSLIVFLTMFRLMEVRSLLKLSQKEVSESCRKASFWQRSACQTTTMSPLSAALITKCLRFFVLFSPVHSSHERLEILVLRLNLSLLIPWRYLLMTKSKDANWPSEGVHLDFWIWSVSKYLCLRCSNHPLCREKRLLIERGKGILNVLLSENSSAFRKCEQNLSPYWERIFLGGKVEDLLEW